MNSIKPIPIKIHVANIKIKQFKEFKYLRSIFTEAGKIDQEIDIRTQKANAVTF
jgi:hypothetical protein